MAIDTQTEAIVPLRIESDTGIIDAPPTVSKSEPSPKRRHPWVAPTAVGLVGLVISGTLGGLLWSTTSQRDAARHHLAATQATLASARVEAAAHQVNAAYGRLFIADSGKVLTDYENVIACNDFSQCRTAAQQQLSDLQAFQADRAAATVPAALTSADGALRDALSAGIAANQEFIAGIDNNDDARSKEGGDKVDAAILSISKAATTLGAALR